MLWHSSKNANKNLEEQNNLTKNGQMAKYQHFQMHRVNQSILNLHIHKNMGAY